MRDLEEVKEWIIEKRRELNDYFMNTYPDSYYIYFCGMDKGLANILEFMENEKTQIVSEQTTNHEANDGRDDFQHVL